MSICSKKDFLEGEKQALDFHNFFYFCFLLSILGPRELLCAYTQEVEPVLGKIQSDCLPGQPPKVFTCCIC